MCLHKLELSENCKKMNISEKKINFGIINDKNHDYYKTHIFVEYGIKNGCFSACISIYEKNKFIAGGQCFDLVKDYFFNQSNELFIDIYNVWLEYHLNDLKAGTFRQEIIIKNYLKENNLKYDYNLVCKILKDNNLYYDDSFLDKNNKPYQYGSAWLKEDIPQDIFDKVLSWS